jgi:hypothetical protein
LELTRTFASVAAKKTCIKWQKKELDTLVSAMNGNMESVKGQVQVVDSFKEQLMDLSISIAQQAEIQQTENNDASTM